MLTDTQKEIDGKFVALCRKEASHCSPTAVQSHHVEIADIIAICFSQPLSCLLLTYQVTHILSNKLTLRKTKALTKHRILTISVPPGQISPLYVSNELLGLDINLMLYKNVTTH